MDDTKHDAAISAAIAAEYNAPPRGTPFDISTIYRIVFRAGYAAGSADLATARERNDDLRNALFFEREHGHQWRQRTEKAEADLAAARKLLREGRSAYQEGYFAGWTDEYVTRVDAELRKGE